MQRDEAYQHILNTKNQTKEEARASMRRLFKSQLKGTGIEFIMVTDEEIDAVDYTNVHAFFNKLERQWRAYKGRVMLIVDGYDDSTKELYEIPAVQTYFNRLFTEYPQYLYYLSEDAESFQLAVLFLASDFQKDASTTSTFMERLESFDGDYDAFDKQMDELRMDVVIAITDSAFETLAMKLTEWFLAKHEVGEAYDILNRIKSYLL